MLNEVGKLLDRRVSFIVTLRLLQSVMHIDL